jgi:putative membrane protein
MKCLELTTTDHLALVRTKLANERTLLAYFRTFIVLLSSGVAILKLELLSEIRSIGILLLIITPILFLIGLFRFLYVKKKINRYYQNQ